MLVSRLPPPRSRCRLGHRAALLGALTAARCALRLTHAVGDRRLRTELLRAAEAQLDVARGAAERLT